MTLGEIIEFYKTKFDVEVYAIQSTVYLYPNCSDSEDSEKRLTMTPIEVWEKVQEK